MTFADWQRLSPAEVARTLHAKADALRPGQREAVFAMLACEEEIAGRLERIGEGVTANPLLAGVPFVVKDVFDAAGWPTKAGSTFLDEERPRPEADGVLVKTLRETGAVLAGKTHLHEFAYGITGENPHYGYVEHPRLPGRTSGGSSSGSAAAVAAGVVPLAFGTDTAGSIRVPAAFCGLFGFRMAPHHPWIADAFPLAPSFDTAGWFTANAGDMAASFQALLGVKATGRVWRGAWLPFGDVDTELVAAQASAAASLCGPLEAELADRLRVEFAEAPKAFGALRGPEAWAVHANWAERRKDAYDPVVFARVIAGRDMTAEAQAAAKVARERLIAAFGAVWERYDFLVLPATPCVAPVKADCTQATRDRIFQLTTPVSLAGLPALTLPVALPGGFSTGLQMVAPTCDAPVFADVLALTYENHPTSHC
ncbi:amidase [Rariglobus hedericola]|uniref:Amidase n=2 Tax=Rariglobus hedericola TaxID=2597822 RepID=A0A556QSU3_9BACT|nr:amidase [Rariglobus hedericola]